MAICPDCQGTRLYNGLMCQRCNGGGRVDADGNALPTASEVLDQLMKELEPLRTMMREQIKEAKRAIEEMGGTFLGNDRWQDESNEEERDAT